MASGSLVDDFEIMGLTKDDLTARFAVGLEDLSGLLGGAAPGRLTGDPAIRRCTDHPVPVLSAAMSTAAVRRAAIVGAGLLFDSLSAPDRICELVEAYRAAGGSGPTVAVRRAWVGPPPQREAAEQLDVYRSYATSGAQAHWKGEQMVSADDPADVAEGLAGVVERCGVDALNVRLHVPGLRPEQVRSQIGSMASVISRLRQHRG